MSETLPFHKDEASDLIAWFYEHSVRYPWGDNPTSYRVWISEIMLQQTVVSAAVGHFQRWMHQFPDIRSLAASTEQDVLKAWEGLGYYSRARNIFKAALYLVEEQEGSLPDSYEELIKVPGIGDYTARAILSLAFTKPYPVLDANVRRIGQRLRGIVDWTKKEDEELVKALEILIPEDIPGIFNCALMQLGQLVCRVKSPHCDLCPLRKSCRCRELKLQDEIPKPKKRKIKEKSSSLLLFTARGKYLLSQRSRGIGKGLWFIPSVALEEEQSALGSIQVPILEDQPLKKQIHLYTSWKEELHPRLIRVKDPFDDLPEWVPKHKGDLCHWVKKEELQDYPVPSVYRLILDHLP